MELVRNNETLTATTENLSGAGVLLHFKDPIPFAVGDEVTCEIKMRSGTDQPLPSWGVGKVVRIDGAVAAIELSAASFDAVPPDDSPEAA